MNDPKEALATCCCWRMEVNRCCSKAQVHSTGFSLSPDHRLFYETYDLRSGPIDVSYTKEPFFSKKLTFFVEDAAGGHEAELFQ